CDVYVDTKLAEFEEFLSGTIRSVGRGRQQLRTGSGVPDYGPDPSGEGRRPRR
ncbi:MAG: DivIVA domain-containing protein, partial [Rhodococcus sp. (in: high G+C Gram-positive bacteria)]